MTTDHNHEASSSSKSTVKQVAEVLRHPFVLFLIGVVTTSLLVPYLNSKINGNQLLQEARLKKAIEIGNHNTQFNSKFNALKTMLESFHNQNVRLRLEPAEFRQAQLKFRDDFTRRYLDLDEVAWWWHPDLEREASVMSLIPTDELQALDVDSKEYGNNVNKSFTILRPLWQELTSRDYNPNEVKSTDKINKIVTETQALSPLFDERRILIERITKHFTSLK